MVSLIVTKLRHLLLGHPPLPREDRMLLLVVAAAWVLEGEKSQNLSLQMPVPTAKRQGQRYSFLDFLRLMNTLKDVSIV